MLLRKENHITVTTQVPLDRCFGDIKSGVRPFPPYTPEITEDEEALSELPETIREALNLGIIVFVTESDGWMFYVPEDIDIKTPEVIGFLGLV